MRFLPSIEFWDWRHGDRRMAGGLNFSGLCVKFDMAIDRATHAIEMDTLMRAIPAGGVAKVATDTLLFVNSRHDLIVQVQIFPLGDARQA